MTSLSSNVNDKSMKSQNQNQNQIQNLIPPPPPKQSSSNISLAEIRYILAGCTANFRCDGRSNLDMRPYSLITSSSSSSDDDLKFPPLILSNGSSRLMLPGSITDIFCSIKADIVHPSPVHPNRGIVDFHLDLLPYSAATSNDRKATRNMEREVQSILSNLIFEYIVDLKSLVIQKGRYVWRLSIDLFVINYDGNLMDCCSLAIWGALQNLKLPKVTPVLPTAHSQSNNHETNLTHQLLGTSAASNIGGSDKHATKSIWNELLLDSDITHGVQPQGIDQSPIIVTISLLPKYTGSESDFEEFKQSSNITSITDGGGVYGSAIERVKKRNDSIFIVDPSESEESCSCTKVSVSVDPSGNICGIYKYGSSSSLPGGGGGIPFAILREVSNIAVAVSKRAFNICTSSKHDRKLSTFGATYNYGDMLRSHFELR